MRESMPLLLTESLDSAGRETAHQHIEHCAACGEEWAGYRETWSLLETLPEVEVPARVKRQFMSYVNPQVEAPAANVLPFHRRPAVRWLAQAAAVVIVAGGSYFVGHRRAEPTTIVTGNIQTTPATVTSMTPAGAIQPAAFSIAESRVLPANAISPTIEGRPDIQNVSFTTLNESAGDQIGVSFDITSHVTVTGHPTDKTMVRLMRYVLENEDRMSPARSRAIDWVRSTYSQPGNADPEIARALANVLRSDTHEGVRIKAVETLTNLPSALSKDSREALIQALKTDPNPAVRIKAVEALANLLKKGGQADAATLDTLRAKASQDDENMYVRVKAAEALSNARP
jgi:hypothetical protein